MKFNTCLCACLLLCACITPVHGLHKDQSFHYMNVIEGGFLIGGVTAATQHLLPGVRSHYAEILLRSFRQERATYRLQSAGALENSLGTESYHLLLDRYRDGAKVSSQDLKGIASHVQKARYIVFARIESNRIANHHAISEEPIYLDDDSSSDSESHQHSKILDYTNRTETWQTTRIINANLHVYDLQSQILVWSGMVSKTGKSSNQYTDQIHHHESLAHLLLHRTEVRQYPTAVSTGRVLQWVMEGFGENMPRQDGRR